MFNRKLVFSLVAVGTIAIATIIVQGVSGINLEHQRMRALQGRCWDCWEERGCRFCEWEPSLGKYVKCEEALPYDECLEGNGDWGQNCGNCISHGVDCGEWMWKYSTSDCSGIGVGERNCYGCDNWTGDACD